jgi:hypothetical protein
VVKGGCEPAKEPKRWGTSVAPDAAQARAVVNEGSDLELTTHSWPQANKALLVVADREALSWAIIQSGANGISLLGLNCEQVGAENDFFLCGIGQHTVSCLTGKLASVTSNAASLPSASKSE